MSRKSPSDFNLSLQELRSLRRLNTPAKIQKFLDELPYHHADTAWSPRRVLREGTAHCLEGAVFAAAALRVNGYAPLVFDLEAVNDTDHVLALYRVNGGWGAVAKSNFAGLRFRAPVYRTLRELAMSYFDCYYNLRGERTLRGYSRILNLQRFDHLSWMTTDKPVWFVAETLLEIRHYKLISSRMAESLPRLDKRAFQAGLTGHSPHRRAL